MRAPWMFPLLLLGCPPATTPTEEADTDTDTDADSDTDTDTDADTDTTPRTDVMGVVTGADDTPIADAQIRFCRGQLCLNASTDTTGAFHFDQVAAEPTSLEVLGPFGAGYATSFAAVELTEGVPRTFDVTLLLHDTPSTLNATAEWHTVGTGLRIEAAVSDLHPPAFVDPATEVAGVFVPDAQHPPLDGLTDVVAVWFLEPFDHHAPNGLPMEIDNTFGLAEGDTVQVRVGDYASSTWLDAGTLTVSSGVLTGSARLPLLSTVVITGPVAP
ncbi:MAG: carboxypeptidase regulatory-like domain-containing protein [Myxococcales bacterium]|nr:carboxypeptidase regulatory-like domain-containing protein [Myxococcales bacterium]MCB9669666.1 carboxypeptidase regulatory-like domain-containing protein [Alphaproteobacteria bacterium]